MLVTVMIHVSDRIKKTFIQLMHFDCSKKLNSTKEEKKKFPKFTKSINVMQFDKQISLYT